MRPIVLASALLAVFAASTTARATPVSKTAYFHLFLEGDPPSDTILVGFPSLSFSINPSGNSDYHSGANFFFYSVPLSNGHNAYMVFFNPAAGYPFDFFIEETPDFWPFGLFEYFAGPQLYTGDESDPTFTPGVYELTGFPNARLTISQTPEPSSLLLLGTGVLGCIGVVRRRFVKA